MSRPTLRLPKRGETMHIKVPVEYETDGGGRSRMLAYPADWVKGQLLNVRNAGYAYRITAMGEEYDPRYPERCLEFTSSYDCQQFVSDWYARQSHDPRAM